MAESPEWIVPKEMVERIGGEALARMSARARGEDDTGTQPVDPAPPWSFRDSVTQQTDSIREMLIAKNEAYGNSALEPVRVFSRASAEEQLLVRIDDKLSRLQRGHAYADEDTVTDLIGYLILLKIARAK